MTTTRFFADLQYLFYGGGSDAEYDFLLQAFNDGVTAADLLALVGGGGGAGTPGAVWRVGAGAPSDATGVNGDFYLRSSNGDVYERVSGTYSVVANIKGATGSTGSTGATGSAGADATAIYGDPVTAAHLPFDTDSTFAANSDTKIPSQKAVKTALTFPDGVSVAAVPQWIVSQNERALQRARVKLATGTVKLMVFGDSIVEGVNVTPAEARWINLVKDGLAGAIGVTSPSIGYVSADPISGPTASLWSGAAGTLGANGLGRISWQSASGSTNTRTATLTCDRFAIYYNKGSALGKISVVVDGGSPVTFDTWQAGAGPTAAVWDSSTNGSLSLTLGSHTIAITTQNVGTGATFAVDVAGIMPYVGNASTGIQLYCAGHSAAASWVPSGAELAQVALIQPDVVFLTYGVNDAAFLATPTDTATNFKGAITAINGVCTVPPSYVFVNMWGKGTGTPETTWIPYHTAIFNAAVESKVAYVDIYTNLGAQPDTAISDQTHPDANGCKAFADAVMRAFYPTYPSALPDVKEYSGAGTYTWIKPPGCKSIRIEAIAPGGGGTGGATRATGVAGIGGGGGSAGGAVDQKFQASEIAATLAITIGSPGTGGAGSVGTSTAGSDGGAGGDITLGSVLTASGGLGASNAGGFTPGAGGRSPLSQLVVGSGGSVTPAIATTFSANGSSGVSGGGGSGGAVSAGNVQTAGGAGGAGLGGAGGAGSGTNGAAGGDGTAGSKMRGGGGGAGGTGGNGVTNGGAGGAGGAPGGGGGGGGAGTNTHSAGAGGAGGAGYVRITAA